MTESGNYYFRVMPFGLRNACATYQRMMNKVYSKELLGDILEVYMDHMIVKSKEEIDHAAHLKRVFEQTRKYNMRLNPEKSMFGVQASKFLGFYLTERGIKANPDKCRAFAKLSTPKTKKCIQTLNGMLTSLSRFVTKSAQHALHFFNLLRNETKFEWTDECETTLKHLKSALSQTPILSRPEEGEILYLYLAVSSEAVSAVLIKETSEEQKPTYFTNKASLGPEMRYQKIEKVALALVTAPRRLRQYFLAHTIVVRTDQPIRQILGCPDVAGRMKKWSLELSEFDIHYESWEALKAQVFADFIVEMTFPAEEKEEGVWTVFVDGSSNSKGSKAGVIIENDEGIMIELYLGLSFTMTNNTAEYESFLAGLRVAKDLGAKKVKLCTDSQLVASQVTSEYQFRKEHLQEYVELVQMKMKEFDSVEVVHVPCEQNAREDILSKLASTQMANRNKTVIQEVLSEPSVQRQKARLFEINAISDIQDWQGPLIRYITCGELPLDTYERTKLKRRACSFTLVEGTLYKRGFNIPLIKCLGPNKVREVLAETHDGICVQHLCAKALAKKILRAGYFWPTMLKDAKDYVTICDKCQRHGDMNLAPPAELTSLTSHWPFAWWGIDLLEPFPKAAGQLKYLVVAVDYSTKWIEAKPLAKITAKNVLRFFKRNILARFRIPALVISDNGTQFTDRKFQDYLRNLNIKQSFTSVEYPQANRAAKTANRVILRGIRRRLNEIKTNWAEELHKVL